MNILVAVASRHGSAREIGEVIASTLRESGVSVDLKEPSDVHDFTYDAAIVGSSVYLSQWGETARSFISSFRSELQEVPLWAFSVGLAGVPLGTPRDPRRLGRALLSINPIDHMTFSGRLDMAKLSWGERSIARRAHAPEGDYRDWDKIRNWARGIADDLIDTSPTAAQSSHV